MKEVSKLSKVLRSILELSEDAVKTIIIFGVLGNNNGLIMERFMP